MVKSSISKSAKSSSSVLSHNCTPTKDASFKAKSTVSLCNFAAPSKKPPVVHDVDSLSSLSSLRTRRKLVAKRRIEQEEEESSAYFTESDSPARSSSVTSVRKSVSPLSPLADGEVVFRTVSIADRPEQSPVAKKAKIEDNSSSNDEEGNNTTDSAEMSIKSESQSSEKNVSTPEIVSQSPQKMVVPSSQFSSITNYDQKVNLSETLKESKITFFGLTPGHFRSLFNQIKKLKQCFEQHYDKDWNGIHDFDEFCESTRNFRSVITETETFAKNFFENPPVYECSSMEEFYERNYRLQEQIKLEELEEMQNQILTESAEFLEQLSNENFFA